MLNDTLIHILTTLDAAPKKKNQGTLELKIPSTSSPGPAATQTLTRRKR
jgi:hypothetical protein